MRKLGSIPLLILGAVACSRSTPEQLSEPDDTPPAAELGARGAYTPIAPASDGTIPGAPPAPPLPGTDTDGKPFHLTELRGRRVVLVFYRSSSCGLCTQQLHDLARAAAAYDHLDTEIVAITADPPEVNRRTAELLELDFPIISADHATLARWGVWPGAERYPLPATFIVDREGRLRFAQIGKTAADRVSDATVVFKLRQLDDPAPRDGTP